MPIYEYRCQQCGEKLEVWATLLKEEDVKCRKCGSVDLNKLDSTFTSSLCGANIGGG